MKKSFGNIAFVLIGLAVFFTALSAQNGTGTGHQFHSLLEQMCSGDLAERDEAQLKWQEFCFSLSRPSRELQRSEACTLMAENLGPETPKPVRIWFLRQLQFVGKAECVDAVASLLNDRDVHVENAAYRCLANNPSAKATQKLLEFLKVAESRGEKIKILNALEYRADPACTSAVIDELENPDREVVCASARVLGKLGTIAAVDALSASSTIAEPDVRACLHHALLSCADRLLDEGQIDEGREIYLELLGHQTSPGVRMAVLQGILDVSGDRVDEKVLEWLGGEDEMERTIAAGYIRTLNAQQRERLVAGVETLPKAGKIFVLEAFAAESDRTVLSTALHAATSIDDDVSRAGLKALGSIGDASAVPVLVRFLSSSGEKAAVARESLTILRAHDVDKQILTSLAKESDPSTRIALIEVLQTRRSSEAVPTLLREILHENNEVRQHAMRALRDLAEPEHIPGLVKGLFRTEGKRERDYAIRTVSAVCSRIEEEDRQADPLVLAMADASLEERRILLPVMGRFGNDRVLTLIQEALQSGEPGYVQAGIQAMCLWPDASTLDLMLTVYHDTESNDYQIMIMKALPRIVGLTMDDTPPSLDSSAERAFETVRQAILSENRDIQDTAYRAIADWPRGEAADFLYSLSREAPSEIYRILALSGYIRLANVTAGSSEEVALAMFRKAMDLATRLEEKRQIFSGVSKLGSIEALQFVLPALEDPHLNQEAVVAVLRISEKLKDAHREETKSAVERAIDVATNDYIRWLLKKLLEETP